MDKHKRSDIAAKMVGGNFGIAHFVLILFRKMRKVPFFLIQLYVQLRSGIARIGSDLAVLSLVSAMVTASLSLCPLWQ